MDIGPKPRVRSLVDDVEISDWTGRLVRRLFSVRWVISCPCLSEEYGFAVVPSWEAAIDIAESHVRSLHGEPTD